MLTGTGERPNRYRTPMIPVMVVWAILCPAMGCGMEYTPGCLAAITERNSTGETRTGSLRQADSLFDRLHFAEAAVMYRSLLQGYTRTDSLSCSLTNRLAECLWWQMECEQSERLIRKSIPEAVRTLGEHHTETGKLYLNLGIVSFLTMRSGMTEEYMEQSLEIFVNRYGEDHPLTALACEWLGTAHEWRSDYLIARQYLTRAWKIREHTALPAKKRPRTGSSNEQLLPETLETGNLSRYRGLFYKRFARHDSAVIWFNRALRIFDAAYGPDNVQSVKCLINLCDIYQEANRFDTAMVMYREALERTKRASGESRMARFMTLFNLAEFMDYQGKTTEALEYLNQTIVLYDTAYTGIPLTANPVVLPPCADHYLKLSFIWKARYLMTLYQGESDEEKRLGYLRSALQCDRLIDQINNLIREQIFNYENLLAYEQVLTAIYFSMIQRALEA